MKAEYILTSHVREGEQILLPENPCLQYEGRIDFSKEGGPLWTYPATSVKLRFRGSCLKAVVTNYRAYWDNFLGYLVDGKEHCVKLKENGVSCICLYGEESGRIQDTDAELQNSACDAEGKWQQKEDAQSKKSGSVNRTGRESRMLHVGHPGDERKCLGSWGLEDSGDERKCLESWGLGDSRDERECLESWGLEDSGDERKCLGSWGLGDSGDERERLESWGLGDSGDERQCLESWELGVPEDGQKRQDVHEIVLFKRQDSCHMVQLHGFIGSSDLELLPCEPLPFRRIEVYGDSVSAGEVSEAVDYCGQPDPVHNGEYSNSYYSYAWLTARKLGARLHDIAQGGIALMDGIGYFCEPEQKGMESIFDKVQYQPQILENSPIPLGAGDTREPLQWDFSQYEPQVVIVAVGQNDAHPDNFCGEDYEGEMAVRWRQRYGAFLKKLRSIRPHAHIICMTTILNHDPAWDRAIEEVCAGCGDGKVHHFLFSNNGRGTHGHIRRPEAEKMAEELSAYIESLGEDIWRDTSRLESGFDRAEQGGTAEGVVTPFYPVPAIVAW